MMSAARPTLIINARLIDPETGREEAGALAVEDGVIREQVEMGVAVRMAVLEALSRHLPNAEGR